MHLAPAPTLAFALGVTTSLFSVINPPSSAVVFAGATSGMEKAELRACARKASLTAGIAMFTCAILGQFLFSFFGFTALAMRFVGGVLVFRSALHMLYGDEEQDRSMATERAQAVGKQASDFAIIPFGIPLLAGAGTISTVMGMIVGLSFLEYLTVLAAIIANAWICYLFLAHSPKVLAKLGPIGSKVLTKLMGLILCAVAAQFLINGVKDLALDIHHQLAQPPVHSEG
ncbi:MAG TPA: MarC family protein [Holophagaceae bacterium]|nr:MarC family protein [Holophagaceae bacterium]